MSDPLKLKEFGNNEFKAGKYFTAHDYYLQALEVCPETDEKLFIALNLNLSLVENHLERSGDSVAHATTVIEKDPDNIKAYYRRAQAYRILNELEKAYSDYVQICKRQTNNMQFRKEAEDLRAAIKRKQLIEAMASHEEVVQEEQAPLESVPIPEFTMEYAKQCMEDLQNDKRVHPTVFIEMLKRFMDLNSKMQNIVDLSNIHRVHVVGDTHGQFQDVVSIFQKNGYPSSDYPYLFNGDYVDRGSMGIEILTLLMAFKLADPGCIYLNRGNHETESMNQIYGFEKECKAKYSGRVYSICSEMFNTLPLGHVINKKILVVHGGIITGQETLDDVQKIPRKGQPPEKGSINDLLWSDPMSEKGLKPSPRGYTQTFGPDITESFCKRCGLDFVIRSHQVMQDGICEMHNGKCITVFSAPNYIGQMGNKGAIINLEFDDDYKLKSKKYVKFDAMPIPEKYKPMMYASFGNFY